MKCMSCESEVDPKWKHAIDQNACPFCGKQIMLENVKNCFQILSEAMEELKEYPDQLNDWMFANYNYVKTDSPLIVFRGRKRNAENLVDLPEEELNKQGVDPKLIEKTKRLKAKKDDAFKDLVQEIKNVTTGESSPMPQLSQMLTMDESQFKELEHSLIPEVLHVSETNEEDDGVDNVLFARMQAMKSGNKMSSKEAIDMQRLAEFQGKTSQSRRNLVDAPDGNENRIKRAQ